MNDYSNKKILVIYYTQTGQIKKIIDAVFSRFQDSEIEIEYAELKPQPEYPYPWTYDEFFHVFPESIKGIPCQFESLKTRYEAYDLIVLAYQPWYLSPSIPIHAFLQSKQANELMNNKAVITIIGCRNMWVMAQERVKEYLQQINAQLVGNIVLRDKAPNLLSVFSIVRWLIKGKQESNGLIPRAGVSEKDIEETYKFGEIIKEAIEINNYKDLQKKLYEKGAVEIDPNLLMIERNGHKIFSLWANFIISKGKEGNKKRLFREKLFKYYLFFILFLISPIGIVIFKCIKPFISLKIKKNIRYYSMNEQ